MTDQLRGVKAEPAPGAQPDIGEARYGEAEPRLTSGGRAVLGKILLRKQEVDGLLHRLRRT